MNPSKWQNIKDVMAAALDVPDARRDEFLAGEPDAEVRGEVERLLAALNRADGFIDKPVLVERGVTEDESDDKFIGEKIKDYLIIERIGAGGMGAVYLAERLNSDFKQKVALKLIKRGMDSEAILKRFARERRILSTLNHPNIAGLLDGGISDEGLPFFVMEYVEGLPLNRFCDENDLGLEERLKIFAQICAAVEEAHKNLVIHRDLKPSNIIVNRDGVPKLLDFGIAKLLSDDDTDATATQAKMFTPEYASPEQIKGKTVTTATDVYSLGVILYELLSGHRPFETRGKSLEEIIVSICETEPVRPSSVVSSKFQVSSSKFHKNTFFNPVKNTNGDERKTNLKLGTWNMKLLQGDLDNIILKALRKEPAERYGSARQLADDISRFLQGLPVLARPQTLKYRFGKYVRRHRIGALAAALVLLSLVGGISAATWQAVVAKNERARAEKRFGDVRRLANLVLFDYQDEIAKLEGSTPIRERMIKDGLAYLDSILPESNNDPDLQLEIALAYQKIGDIQGNPFQPNLGLVEPALESYTKSKDIAARLYAENPAKIETIRTLAKAHLATGSIYLTKGEFAAALENLQKSAPLFEKLTADEAERLEAMYGQAQVLRQTGFVYSRQGDKEKALESFQSCLAKYQELTAKAPDVKKYQSGLANAFTKIGDELVAKGEFQKGLENHRQALQINAAVFESEPKNVRFKRNLIIDWSRVSKDLMNLDDLRGAFEASQKALSMQTEIAAADGKNMQYRSELGAYHIIHANIQSRLGEFTVARENALTSVKILAELVEKNPTEAAAKAELGFAQATTAEIFSRGGKNSEAVVFYKQAVHSLDSEGVRGGILGRLAGLYEALADAVLKQQGDREVALNEAKNAYQKSLNIWQDLAQKGKIAPKDAGNPDKIQKKIAGCEKELGKFD